MKPLRFTIFIFITTLLSKCLILENEGKIVFASTFPDERSLLATDNWIMKYLNLDVANGFGKFDEIVYEPGSQSCVFPKGGWKCAQDSDKDSVENSLYSLKRGGNVENATKMTDYSTTTVQTGISSSEFNNDDKSTKINSVPLTDEIIKGEKTDISSPGMNTPVQDPIETQMYRLTQLINILKATSSPHNNIGEYGYTNRPPSPVEYSTLDPSFPFKQETVHFPIQELNLHPAQIYKIMAQIISRAPYPNIHRTNPEFPQPQTKFSIPTSTMSTNYQLVSYLFQKYLTNTSFLKHGEFIKCRTGDRLPNHQDCTKYYICNGRTQLNFTCPPKQAFNRLKNICDQEGFQKCLMVDQNLFKQYK